MTDAAGTRAYAIRALRWADETYSGDWDPIIRIHRSTLRAALYPESEACGGCAEGSVRDDYCAACGKQIAPLAAAHRTQEGHDQ